MELKGMSVQALRALAKSALELAKDLEGKEPTYRLALEAGIKDRSYSTVRYGLISSYAGTAEITMADGKKWKAVGHGTQGDAATLDKEGWIEFIPLD